MSPDVVCGKYLNEKLDLNTFIKEDMVVIEGSKKSLKVLGKILLAQADFKKDCGIQLGPKSAGNNLFCKEAKYGIYIHRLPCIKE